MESAFAVDGCDGSPKSEYLKWLCSVPAFQKVKDDMMEYVDQFYCLFGIFKHTTEDNFFSKDFLHEDSDPKLQSLRQDIIKLCLELEAQHLKALKHPETNSLEQCGLCQIGVFLTCLHIQLKTLCDLKNEILSS